MSNGGELALRIALCDLVERLKRSEQYSKYLETCRNELASELMRLQRDNDHLHSLLAHSYHSADHQNLTLMHGGSHSQAMALPSSPRSHPGHPIPSHMAAKLFQPFPGPQPMGGSSSKSPSTTPVKTSISTSSLTRGSHGVKHDLLGDEDENLEEISSRLLDQLQKELTLKDPSISSPPPSSSSPLSSSSPGHLQQHHHHHSPYSASQVLLPKDRSSPTGEPLTPIVVSTSGTTSSHHQHHNNNNTFSPQTNHSVGSEILVTNQSKVLPSPSSHHHHHHQLSSGYSKNSRPNGRGVDPPDGRAQGVEPENVHRIEREGGDGERGCTGTCDPNGNEVVATNRIYGRLMSGLTEDMDRVTSLIQAQNDRLSRLKSRQLRNYFRRQLNPNEEPAASAVVSTSPSGTVPSIQRPYSQHLLGSVTGSTLNSSILPSTSASSSSTPASGAATNKCHLEHV